MGAKPRIPSRGTRKIRRVVDLLEKLDSIHACASALNWVNDKGQKQAWEECQRGDWMFWLLDMVNKPKRDQLCDLQKAIGYKRTVYPFTLWNLCSWAGMKDVNDDPTSAQAVKLSRVADAIREIWSYRRVARRLNQRLNLVGRKP